MKPLALWSAEPGPEVPSPIPPDVRAAVAAAMAGDRTAVPELRRALAQHPDLLGRLGDLAGHVEIGLIGLLTGSNLVATEAVAAHLSGLRAELRAPSADPLERLLAERVVLCWLACHAAELERVDRLRAGGEPLRAADARVDRASAARLLTATRTLAIVRRLVAPASGTAAPDEPPSLTAAGPGAPRAAVG